MRWEKMFLRNPSNGGNQLIRIEESHQKPDQKAEGERKPERSRAAAHGELFWGDVHERPTSPR